MRSLPAPMRPAATQGGSLQGVALGATGVQVPCLGVGQAGGFLAGAGSAEALSSRSTPETAEFLDEDLQQVHAWAGGRWQGRPVQSVGRGPGGDASWGPRLSHSPSRCPRGPQEERRERWVLLWERTGRWGVGGQPPMIRNPAPLQVEQRLEPAKRAAHNIHKRLQACLQGQSGADMDKRVVSVAPGRRNRAGYLCPVAEQGQG